MVIKENASCEASAEFGLRASNYGIERGPGGLFYATGNGKRSRFGAPRMLANLMVASHTPDLLDQVTDKENPDEAAREGNAWVFLWDAFGPCITVGPVVRVA